MSNISWIGGGGGTSYWSLNGTDIYNNNAGNVGVGTNTPSVKLEVSGFIKTTKEGRGTITVPEGNAVSFQCDIGNTLGDFLITPTGTTQVVYFY